MRLAHTPHVRTPPPPPLKIRHVPEVGVYRSAHALFNSQYDYPAPRVKAAIRFIRDAAQRAGIAEIARWCERTLAVLP